MALTQISQISSESEVCGVKWWHVYSKIVDEQDIVTDIEFTFG